MPSFQDDFLGLVVLYPGSYPGLVCSIPLGYGGFVLLYPRETAILKRQLRMGTAITNYELGITNGKATA